LSLIPPAQVIGVVVAETEPLARRAAKAVKVTYEDLPAIISIEDAIGANSYYEQYHGDSLVSGDLEAGFAGVCGSHTRVLLLPFWVTAYLGQASSFPRPYTWVALSALGDQVLCGGVPVRSWRPLSCSCRHVVMRYQLLLVLLIAIWLLFWAAHLCQGTHSTQPNVSCM
jgi:hypothetical protein